MRCVGEVVVRGVVYCRRTVFAVCILSLLMLSTTRHAKRQSIYQTIANNAQWYASILYPQPESVPSYGIFRHQHCSLTLSSPRQWRRRTP